MESGFKRRSQSRAVAIYANAFTVACCLRSDPDQIAVSTLNSARINTASHLTIAEGIEHRETARQHQATFPWSIPTPLFHWARPRQRQAADRDDHNPRHAQGR